MCIGASYLALVNFNSFRSAASGIKGEGTGIVCRKPSGTGGDAAPVAAAAKAQGVSIYVIGLSGNGGIDEDALKEWASDPAYVAITPSDEELEDLFEDLDVSGDPDT